MVKGLSVKYILDVIFIVLFKISFVQAIIYLFCFVLAIVLWFAGNFRWLTLPSGWLASQHPSGL